MQEYWKGNEFYFKARDVRLWLVGQNYVIGDTFFAPDEGINLCIARVFVNSK